MKYSDVVKMKSMNKQAVWGGLLNAFGDVIQTGADIVAMGGAYVLAAAAASGVGVGYLGAKMTAHGARDEETVQKGYENERLKSDIGYLSSKIKQEWAQSKKNKGSEPTPMRMF